MLLSCFRQRMSGVRRTCMGGGMWSGLYSLLFGWNSEAAPGGLALERSRTSDPEGGCTAEEDGGMPMLDLLDDFTLVI